MSPTESNKLIPFRTSPRSWSHTPVRVTDNKRKAKEKPRQHKFTKRVKTGCLTCKIRRVKCSEERPSCSVCLSSGRKCDGYAAIPVSRRDFAKPVGGRSSILISSQRLLAGYGGDGGSDAQFEYFHHLVLPQTNRHLHSGFWSRLLYQLYRREPCVRYAVIALSSMHQDWGLNGLTVCKPDHGAFFSYQKATQHTNKLLERARTSAQPDQEDILAILVVCILFICFTHASGQYKTSSDHIQSGLNIISEHYPICLNEESREDARAKLKDIIELFEVLQRMEFMTGCFMNTRFSSGFPPNFSRGKFIQLPAQFKSREDSRAHLLALIKWALAISNAAQLPTGWNGPGSRISTSSLHAIELEKRACLQHLDRWSELFEEFNVRVKGCPENFPCNFIWMTYLSTRMMIKVEFSGNEMDYDRYTEDFEHILRRARKMLPTQQNFFSFEEGMIPLLGLVACRCRHPKVRREAIALLASRKGKEGLWEGPKVALLASTIMAIEEEGIPDVERPEDIPYTARVIGLKTASKRYGNEIKVVMNVWRPGSANPEHSLIHKTVPMPI